MVKIKFVDANGVVRTIDAKPGQSVMESAVKNNVPGIVADCGGSCACATCRVYVDDAWQTALGPPTDMEQSMIEYCEDPTPNVRLSCQLKVTQELEGLVVRTPESQH
jgi:ferredoxin, 2Fe-2S